MYTNIPLVRGSHMGNPKTYVLGPHMGVGVDFSHMKVRKYSQWPYSILLVEWAFCGWGCHELLSFSLPITAQSHSPFLHPRSSTPFSPLPQALVELMPGKVYTPTCLRSETWFLWLQLCTNATAEVSPVSSSVLPNLVQNDSYDPKADKLRAMKTTTYLTWPERRTKAEWVITHGTTTVDGSQSLLGLGKCTCVSPTCLGW